MNVGQLLRSLLNDAQPGEPRTLELKVGQIVKGLVLQLLSEQDALVNIGGVQVKAHLETPLKQGEVAMLQVQPESVNGQITLKPLANPTVLIADGSLMDLMDKLGLKDTAANRQILQTMHQENIPLSKENMQAIAKVMAAIPANVQPEQWMQSTLLAVKNQLPVTMESVSALQQVVYGTPINRQLEQLSQQMNIALQNQALPKEVTDLITQIKALVQELQTTSTQAFQSPANEGKTDSKAAASLLAAPHSLTADSSKAVSSIGAESTQAAKTTEQTAGPSIQASSVAAKQAEINASHTANSGVTKAGNDAVNEVVKQALASAENSKLSGATSETIAVKVEANQEADAPEWIGKWLKSLGIEHEQQLFKALDKATPFDKPVGHTAILALDPEVTLEGNRLPNEAAKQLVTESLKAALLQLNAMTETPAALKESTQQLLQQITGQQLLLTSDRTSMFSHITMMIPMNNEQGQQMAAVHIQSRRGSRGEIDANNCRLVFDLRMDSIGDTLVDVQVYNKVVSLHVHNDHDFVAALLEDAREEIAASLHNVGFQFLSLKTSPFPEQEAMDLAASNNETTRSSNAAAYASKPYKGVDLRV